MFRNIAGEGRLLHATPPAPAGTDWPSRFTTSAMMPGSGRVAEPGLVAIAPGSGEIRIEPVSVCHHVSTMGQRPRPIVSRYHIHASGLIGSPPLPSKPKLFMACFPGPSPPTPINPPTAAPHCYKTLPQQLPHY